MRIVACIRVGGMECIIVNVMWNGNMWKWIDFICKSMPVSIICTHRVSIILRRSMAIQRNTHGKIMFLLLLSWRTRIHICARYVRSLSPLKLTLSLILSAPRSSCLASAQLRLVRLVNATHKLDVCDHYGICIRFFHFIPVCIFLPPFLIIIFFFFFRRLLFRDRAIRWEKREIQMKKKNLNWNDRIHKNI